ncbi:MAG: serine/threonine-protein kinase [Myxococcaceae bacterium]
MLVEPTAIRTPRASDSVPGYRLERLVGKGGMGEVHRAQQLSLGRTVAVKLLNPELAKDPQFVTRFEKEAAALAALSHPSIVAIVDKGRTHDGTYFLVMEFIEGPSLRELMRTPLFDIAAALRCVLEIARGVDYAHNRGIVHRDLKPENILFHQAAGGLAKVTDFGLAAFVAGDAPSHLQMTQTHVSMGTLAYMAPEQKTDAKNVDGRADIYALGVILYELLAGELPMGAFSPPSEKNPSVDKRLDVIVHRCLQQNPADRFASMAELIAALEPMAPALLYSALPKRLSPFDRTLQKLKAAGRWVLRGGEMIAVTFALGVLGLSYVRSTRTPRAESVAQDLAAPELLFQTSRTLTAQLEEDESLRRIEVQDGEATVPLLAQGRPVDIDATNGRVLFDNSSQQKWVGRAQFDIVDLDGIAASFSAETTHAGTSPGFLTRVRNALYDTPHQAHAALLLLGGTGRYAALLAPKAGDPLIFEWALGERRGTLKGPPAPVVEQLRLMLRVDREGRLYALYAPEGGKLKPVGESVNLGKEWKAFFGKSPTPAVGCFEAVCTFDHIRYEIEREAPVLGMDVEPSQGATVRAVPTKKPGVAPQRRRRQ